MVKGEMMKVFFFHIGIFRLKWLILLNASLSYLLYRNIMNLKLYLKGQMVVIIFRLYQSLKEKKILFKSRKSWGFFYFIIIYG